MELSKRASKPLITIGLVIIALGTIFTLQGESVVGPPSSFMYNNPTWTVNGYIIIGIGLGVIALGAIMRHYPKA
jgi:hypothetical protein